MANEAVLRTENLSKRFGGVVAADRIDFGLRRGETRCVIGPNGAGKSTFFALLCGILRPDTGDVFLDGRAVTRLPAFRRVRLGLGLTFQTNRAFHALTVAENLGPPGVALAVDRATMLIFAPPTLQRAGRIARSAGARIAASSVAMAGNRHGDEPGPQLLLLDEPTAGMSPEETKHTAEVLRSLTRDGLAVLVVEHDVAFVRKIAASVTVLHLGRVFAQGSIDEIMARDDVRRSISGTAGERRTMLADHRVAQRLWTGDVLQGVILPLDAARS